MTSFFKKNGEIAKSQSLRRDREARHECKDREQPTDRWTRGPAGACQSPRAGAVTQGPMLGTLLPHGQKQGAHYPTGGPGEDMKTVSSLCHASFLAPHCGEAMGAVARAETRASNPSFSTQPKPSPALQVSPRQQSPRGQASWVTHFPGMKT